MAFVADQAAKIEQAKFVAVKQGLQHGFLVAQTTGLQRDLDVLSVVSTVFGFLRGPNTDFAGARASVAAAIQTQGPKTWAQNAKDTLRRAVSYASPRVKRALGWIWTQGFDLIDRLATGAARAAGAVTKQITKGVGLGGGNLMLVILGLGAFWILTQKK